jgi:hypothetical protein
MSQKIANLLLEDGDWDFSSEVKEVSVFYYENTDPGVLEVYGSDFTVEWTVEPELRSSGLKGFICIVKKIRGSLFVEYEDESKEQKEITVEVDFDTVKFDGKVQQGWTVEEEGFGDKQLRDDVFPYEIEFNFRDKEILVKF